MRKTVIQRFVISEEEVIEIQQQDQKYYLVLIKKGQVVLNDELRI